MKYKDFYSYLEEMALPLSTAKKYVKASDGKYKNLLSDIFSNKHRIYIPFDSSITKDVISYIRSRPSNETGFTDLTIQFANANIENKGTFTMGDSDDDVQMDEISFGNYVKNICHFFDSKKGEILKDKNGNEIEFKIGKVIQKYLPDKKQLLKTFNNDPYRQIFGKKLKIVISRHPYDIAGMSTDRNWSSCMDLGTERIVYKHKEKDAEPVKGSNADKMKGEVNAGNIIAYIIMDGDENIKKPISRALIKAFRSVGNRDLIYYNVARIYGVPINQFQITLQNWIDENINKKIENGSYIKSGGHYDTGDERTSKDNINLFGRFDEYTNHFIRDIKNSGIAVEYATISLDNEDNKDVATGDITYSIGKSGIFSLTKEKAERLGKILDKKYTTILNNIEFDYDSDSMNLAVYFTIKVEKNNDQTKAFPQDDYEEMNKFFEELKVLVPNIRNKKYEI